MGANPQCIIGKNCLTKLQKTAIVRTITAITVLVEILKLSPEILEDLEAVVVVVAIEEAKHLIIHQPVE